MLMQMLRDAETLRRNPTVVAKEVLQEVWGGSVPVDPGRIASDLGVELYARGSPEDPYPYSGYFRMIDGQPIIEYNRTDALVRRRFTVAHELGHFMLKHSDAPRDVPGSFGATVADPTERAANQFAAELLMPADAVKKVILSGQMSSLQELANAFVVSKVAMGFRLRNLQLTL